MRFATCLCLLLPLLFQGTACRDDDERCGDGRAQAAEECDLADLRDTTCSDLVSSSGGTLSCTDQCTFDTSGCTVCGDGVMDGTETCDCGTDLAPVPAGCTDSNGGPEANCSATCDKLPFCGDGVTDAGEQCDCGRAEPLRPAACDALNGDPDSACTAACGYRCSATGECPWARYCDDQSHRCVLATCGPQGELGGDLNDLCQVPGGLQGWCAVDATLGASPLVGLCHEAGTIEPGSPCDATPLSALGRGELVCDMGRCVGTGGSPVGACYQFCDWEIVHARKIYDASDLTDPLPCPVWTDCRPLSEGAPCAQGVTASVCWPVPTVGEGSSCSLITDQLFTVSSLTCSLALTNGRCEPLSYGPDPSPTTLVGACTPGDPPTAGVWEPCNPVNDVCPPGSTCLREDLLGDPPSGEWRCVPYCDTGHHANNPSTCQEAHPTVAATAVCTSVDELHCPDNTDQRRLGYCALPP